VQAIFVCVNKLMAFEKMSEWIGENPNQYFMTYDNGPLKQGEKKELNRIIDILPYNSSYHSDGCPQLFFVDNFIR